MKGALSLKNYDIIHTKWLLFSVLIAKMTSDQPGILTGITSILSDSTPHFVECKHLANCISSPAVTFDFSITLKE